MCPQMVAFASNGGSSGSFEPSLPYWASISSESDGTYIINDCEETGVSMTKLKDLLNAFYKYDGYYFGETYPSGGMSLHFYVPDEAAFDLINNGYELVVLPTTAWNGNYLFDFCLIKDNEVVAATGSCYQARTNVGLRNYVVHKVSACSVGYYSDYEYECDVRLYIGDYSEYCPSVSDVRNAIFGGLIPALNESDFLPARYGVLEAPRDIKFNNDRIEEFLNADVSITFTWSQTDENYKLWDTEILVYADFKYRTNILIFGKWHYGDNILVLDDVIETKNLKYSFKDGEVCFNGTAVNNYIYEDLGHTSVQYSTEKLEIFIRNKYSDDKYNYYSNWVKLTITSEGAFYDEDDYKNGHITGEEYDYDDPINGDSDIDFTVVKPNGVINPDSPYQGGVLGSYLDGFDLSDGLSNGFGLAGDNGIIEMFQDLFSFIPDSIWSLIVSGIIVLISIALLKAVF